MEFSSLYNFVELQQILGAKIKETRIDIGRFTQKEQAQAAGVPYSTYRRIELQGKGSIEDLIKILISLGKVSDLNALFMTYTDSVIENYNISLKNKPRKRIYRKREKI